MKRYLLALAVCLCAWPPLGWVVVAEARATEGAKPAAAIVMYTTQSCPYCAKAREWFAQRNLTWDERDIEASLEARAEWKNYGGMGTPLILINGKRFNGFAPDQLDQELAKYR